MTGAEDPPPVAPAQERLRALLEAQEFISSDLALDRVLQHVVESARRLVDARYAALGVIAHDGGLERFVHSGFDADTVARIGRPPQGKGLLGALITDPSPIRLKNLTEDPRSAGIPAHHPSMRSFLGVPISVRGMVFGNLYLTESERGEFTAEDEELVTALALAAGAAISNAQLYHDSRVQQRWLRASVDIGEHLLALTGEDPLQTIARYASEISDADLVAVSVLSTDGEDLVVEIAIGRDGDRMIGQRFGVAGSLAGRAVLSRQPELLRSSAEAGVPLPILGSVIEAGPLMVIPLLGAQRALGVLHIVRRKGAALFSTSDLEMAAGFAAQASVALELANARADQQRMVLLEDRDRIARDLHDHVIQQLFAIGLSLQGLAAAAGPDHVLAGPLEDRVQDIDRTIRQIRTSIFALRGPLSGSSRGLRGTLLELSSELTPVLGFSPGLTFAGPVDTVVDGELADDVVACVREGLTNIAKYAKASRAYVDLVATGQGVAVRVIDDGVGIPGGVATSGLRNLRMRAERRGGTFEVHTATTGGTELVWKAPIA